MIFRSTKWKRGREWVGRHLPALIATIITIGGVGGVSYTFAYKFTDLFVDRQETYEPQNEEHNGIPNPEPLYTTSQGELYE